MAAARLASVPDCHSTFVARLTVQILQTSKHSHVYHVLVLDVCKLVLLPSHKNPCSRTKYSAILCQETLLFWKHNYFSSDDLVDEENHAGVTQNVSCYMTKKSPLYHLQFQYAVFLWRKELYKLTSLCHLISLYLKNTKLQVSSWKQLQICWKAQKLAFVPILTTLWIDILFSLKVQNASNCWRKFSITTEDKNKDQSYVFVV